jgi:hypothetical protein
MNVLGIMKRYAAEGLRWQRGETLRILVSINSASNPWHLFCYCLVSTVLFSCSPLRKICGTGFANLSSLDDGFYGKGIYFTTYALYALPYFQ